MVRHQPGLPVRWAERPCSPLAWTRETACVAGTQPCLLVYDCLWLLSDTVGQWNSCGRAGVTCRAGGTDCAALSRKRLSSLAPGMASQGGLVAGGCWVDHLRSHCHTSLVGATGLLWGPGCFYALALLLDLTVASSYICIIAPPPVTFQPHSEPWSGLADLGELAQVHVNTLTDWGGGGGGGCGAARCPYLSLFPGVCYAPHEKAKTKQARALGSLRIILKTNIGHRTVVTCPSMDLAVEFKKPLSGTRSVSRRGIELLGGDSRGVGPVGVPGLRADVDWTPPGLMKRLACCIRPGRLLERVRNAVSGPAQTH